MKKLLVLVFGSIALFLSCTRHQTAPQAGKSAEEVVKVFVQLSASAKEVEDRKRLQDYCSGELRRTFERMNDEAFRLIYLDGKIAILDLKILESKEDKDTARVAYQITVDNKQGTDPTREVNSREVELERSQGAWYIESIRMKGSDQIAFTRGMLF